jgi:hypothetical protein
MIALAGMLKRGFGAARNALSRAPMRLKVLLTILVLACVGAGVVKTWTWGLERQLWKIAEDIVLRINAEDPIIPDMEPSRTNTTCEVYCSYKYLVFGPATGKIVFLISPLCTDEHQTKKDRLACFICSGRGTHELDYIYLRGKDGWKFYESYLSHSGESRYR